MFEIAVVAGIALLAALTLAPKPKKPAPDWRQQLPKDWADWTAWLPKAKASELAGAPEQPAIGDPPPGENLAPRPGGGYLLDCYYYLGIRGSDGALLDARTVGRAPAWWAYSPAGQLWEKELAAWAELQYPWTSLQANRERAELVKACETAGDPYYTLLARWP